MPDQTNLAKAQLRQINADPEHPKEIEPDTWCTVQFNPESLKVSFKNEVAKPPGPGDQRGPAALQYVGKSTTQLSLTLWFDVGSPQGSRRRVDDVRLLTKEVAFFIKASPPKGKKVPLLIPLVRFVWGSFIFDGVMESLEETLELFSPQGKPLRASLAVSFVGQGREYPFHDKEGAAAGSGAGGATTPGTAPLEHAAAGSTVQGIADAAGSGVTWQSIAAANGIENPRLLAPGTLLDLNLQAPTIATGFGVPDALEVGPPQLSASVPVGLS